ncbi:hypothetical protein A0H81_12422 [Grifola frondosa]|uniref:Chromo domain-containing protein n=1 Tax=Grifola frondosa TaxID=5627 RepID=A0A1C7LSC5_GRIFR|nr:hypothetical protein A0H81_12422 [Grifola frondosa]
MYGFPGPHARSLIGPGSGYDPLPVCAFCIENLQITAGGKGQLRQLPLSKLRKYADSYHIDVSGVIEKDELIDKLIAIRGPNGCLPLQYEDYYRKHSVPNRSTNRPRGIFTRAMDAMGGDRPHLRMRLLHLIIHSRSHINPVHAQRPAQAASLALILTRMRSGAPRPPRPNEPPLQYPRPQPQHYVPPPGYPPRYPHTHFARPTNPPPSGSTAQGRPRAASASSTQRATSPVRPPVHVPTLDELLQMPDEQVPALSIGILKEVLFHNHVNARLVVEKSELVTKVRTLVEQERLERERKARDEEAERAYEEAVRREREEEEQRKREEAEKRQRVQEDNAPHAEPQEAEVMNDHIAVEGHAREDAPESEGDGSHIHGTTSEGGVHPTEQEPPAGQNAEVESISTPPKPSVSPPPASTLTPKAQAMASRLERTGLCVICQDEEANIAVVDCGTVQRHDLGLSHLSFPYSPPSGQQHGTPVFNLDTFLPSLTLALGNLSDRIGERLDKVDLANERTNKRLGAIERSNESLVSFQQSTNLLEHLQQIESAMGRFERIEFAVQELKESVNDPEASRVIRHEVGTNTSPRLHAREMVDVAIGFTLETIDASTDVYAPPSRDVAIDATAPALEDAPIRVRAISSTSPEHSDPAADTRRFTPLPLPRFGTVRYQPRFPSSATPLTSSSVLEEREIVKTLGTGHDSDGVPSPTRSSPTPLTPKPVQSPTLPLPRNLRGNINIASPVLPALTTPQPALPVTPAKRPRVISISSANWTCFTCKSDQGVVIFSLTVCPYSCFTRAWPWPWAPTRAGQRGECELQKATEETQESDLVMALNSLQAESSVDKSHAYIKSGRRKSEWDSMGGKQWSVRVAKETSSSIIATVLQCDLAMHGTTLGERQVNALHEAFCSAQIVITLDKQRKFFIERFIGRRPQDPHSGGHHDFLWLVKWDGYKTLDSTWMLPSRVGNCAKHIEDFEAAATLEGHELSDWTVVVVLNEAAAVGW